MATLYKGGVLPQHPTMPMFSSQTLITGGIITQAHGNVIQVYGAPEGALLTLEKSIDSSNKGQDPWALFNALQPQLLSTTPSNALTHLNAIQTLE